MASSSAHAVPPAPHRWRSRRRPLTILIASVAALLLTAGTALAVISPTPQTNTIGAGGYDQSTTSTTGFTDTQAVVNPGQYGLIIATGRAGIQLCNSTSGESAKMGLLSSNLNTLFAVQTVVAAAAGCPNNGPLTGVTLANLSAVPYNHHVWQHIVLTKKVKTQRILICVLSDRHTGRPVTPPTVTPPTATPTSTPTSTASPTPSATLSRALVRWGNDPSGTASAEPTDTSSAAPSSTPPSAGLGAPTITPTPSPTATQLPSGQLPGTFVKCRIITRTIARNVVLFEAQDLDAPVSTPVAGDLPGVQSRTVPVPAGTTFNHASAGLNANTNALTACVGGGFPKVLAGPAAYTTAACQPVDTFTFATYADGTSPSQPYGAGTATELISPATGAALEAPNNSLTPTSTGSPGTASDASTTGAEFIVDTGNAPVVNATP